MISPIALFKDSFHCSLLNQSVSIDGTKRELHINGNLVTSAIMDAECSGEPSCKLSLKSACCPKKTNLNDASV